MSEPTLSTVYMCAVGMDSFVSIGGVESTKNLRVGDIQTAACRIPRVRCQHHELPKFHVVQAVGAICVGPPT